MTVRELVAKFGLNIDQSAFKRADAQVERLKKAAMALGSLWAGSKIVGAAKQLAQETAALGDGLNIMSARSGIAIDAIQELRYAGEAAGVSVGEVDASLQGFSRRLGSAANGNKAMASAFAAAGLKIRDASGKVRSADDVLMDLSDRMAKMPSESQRAAVAMSLMGGNGVRMAAALGQGSESVRALRQEARDLGLVEASLAAESTKLVMNQQRLRYAIQWVKTTIASALIPWLNKSIQGWLEWLKVNREMIKLRLQEAVKAIGVALEAVAKVVRSVWTAVDHLTSKLGPFGKALAMVLGIATALLMVFSLKAIIIGAVVALIGLLIDELVTALQGGDTLIGEIIDSLRALWHEFLARDISWDSHPVLAFLQSIAKAVDYALTLAGKLFGLFRNPPKWLRVLGAINPVVGLAVKGAEWAGAGADARHLAQAEADWKERLPGFDPNYVSPRERGGGPVSVTQNIELNFTPAEGVSGDELQSRVKAGISDANSQALRLVPAYSGFF